MSVIWFALLFLHTVMHNTCLFECDRLMSWRVPQKEHERVSETGVFSSLDRVSGTLCLSHFVTEISHLNSLRDFWRHFGLCRAATHSDCCFFALCKKFLLTYLLTTISDRGCFVVTGASIHTLSAALPQHSTGKNRLYIYQYRKKLLYKKINFCTALRI